MHDCLKRLIYIKTNAFLHLPHILLKSFFDIGKTQNVSFIFLTVKDNTEYICLKPTLNR